MTITKRHWKAVLYRSRTVAAPSMSRPYWKTALATALCAAACSQPGLAQGPRPAILVVDLENRVEYYEDVGDPTKFATDPGVTTRLALRNFSRGVQISDIVAVNGQPAKGVQIISDQILVLRPSPTPGQGIAD